MLFILRNKLSVSTVPLNFFKSYTTIIYIKGTGLNFLAETNNADSTKTLHN